MVETRIKKAFILCTILINTLLLTVWASPLMPQVKLSKGNELDLSEDSQFAFQQTTLALSPGDVLFLRLNLNENGFCLENNGKLRSDCQLNVQFLDQKTPLYPLNGQKTSPQKTHQWGAFLGIDMQHPPGPGTLKFDLRNGKGVSFSHSLAIQISLKQFPVIKLKVPPKMVQFSKKIQERIQSELLMIKNIMAQSHQEALWREAQLPVDTRVNTFFGTTRVFNKTKKSPHTGVDLRAQQGMPVNPLTRGMVIYTGNLYLAGKTVIIDHGHNIVTGYMHLSKILSSVQEVLEVGQKVGLAGKTGRATGPHLHWMANIGGKRVDPLQLYQAFLKI